MDRYAAWSILHEADTGLYVFNIQIKKLEDWFKAAEAIRYATGEGNLGETDAQEGSGSALFDFNVSASDLEMLKNGKKRGPSKKVGDDSLQSMFFIESKYVRFIRSDC